MIPIMETKNEQMFEINGETPFEPVHPGRILGEELKARGISQKAFASKIGLQATHISALIHGTRNITPAVAARIESGLGGIPAEMWIRLQNSYNIAIQRKSLKTSLLVSGYSFREAPVSALADREAAYGGRIRVQLSIPEEDRELIASLASRLGWRFV